MFEKEAKSYAKRKFDEEEQAYLHDIITQTFQRGAEFGYSKANEWHNLKKDPNDLPNDHHYVWTNAGAGYHDEDGWWDDYGRLPSVTAWCEPKFQEGEKQGENLEKAKKLIRNLLYVYQLGKNELAIARVRAEAEQFLKEVSE